MKWIGRLYILFVGIIFCITTGFGIAAFYPQPIRPTYPVSQPFYSVPANCNATAQAQSSPDCQTAFQKQEQIRQQDETTRAKYDEDTKVFNNKNAGYTRTAVFFGIAVGAIFAVIGLALIKSSKLVAVGLLLSGVLTAILTRLLIGLASLGSSVSGTQGADTIAYIEFGVLFVLSVAVTFVGLYTLKESSPQAV